MVIVPRFRSECWTTPVPLSTTRKTFHGVARPLDIVWSRMFALRLRATTTAARSLVLGQRVRVVALLPRSRRPTAGRAQCRVCVRVSRVWGGDVASTGRARARRRRTAAYHFHLPRYDLDAGRGAVGTLDIARPSAFLVRRE